MSTGPRSERDVRTRRALVLALDVINVAFVAAIFLGGREPDVLFHGVWVILVIQAFIFGLPTGLLRLAIATSAIVVYWSLSSSHIAVVAPLSELELGEWPVMFVIALLVAIMADRQGSEGRHYAALYRRTSERLISAQEDERRRFARDLHDGVGQTLTALSLTLDAAESMLWDGPEDGTDPRRATVRHAQYLASAAVEETHEVALRLIPSRIADVGLVAAVRELAALAGIPVQVTADASLERHGLLAPETELEVFRIVQEAVGNAARHSQASIVKISIRTVDGSLKVDIADDGIGIGTSAAESRGLGLVGMLERATTIAGSLQVVSQPNEGTTVRLTVPLGASTSSDPGSARRAPEAAATRTEQSRLPL